jgi:hypothetical protein
VSHLFDIVINAALWAGVFVLALGLWLAPL